MQSSLWYIIFASSNFRKREVRAEKEGLKKSALLKIKQSETNAYPAILPKEMKVQGLLDNTSQQMRKGILELCILSIISDEGEAYPTDIINRLEQSEMIVVQGTLYPLLARLKSAGLLSYTWKESAAGPPRKYYSLTDDGKEFLDGLMGTWKQLVTAVKNSTQSLTAN